MAINDDTIVLTIARDSRALHVGTARNTAMHLGAAGPSAVEYYDPTGQPLRLVMTGSGPRFAPMEELPPVPEAVLLGRIDIALANMQAVQDKQGGDSSACCAPLAEGKVPRPKGPLSDVLSELAVVFDFLAPNPTRGNWIHQLAHAAGLAH